MIDFRLVIRASLFHRQAMNKPLQLNLLVALAVGGLVGGVTGCQSTKGKLAAMNPISGMGEAEPEIGVPVRVAGTWTEAVLHQSGEGTRGFGGRLFFYDQGSADPIRVRGQLVVYAFAEDARKESDNKPTKRYVFPAAQFAKHESESDIGISYSVWLPWDAVGGEQTEVSLIARFEPSQGGGLVVSDQTRQRLPGRPRPETLLADKAKTSPIQQMSSSDAATQHETQAVYQEPAVPQKARMTATTISLPSRFNSPAQPAQLPSSPRASTSSSAAASSPNVESVSTGGAATTLQPTPVGTSVEYLTPGESVRRSLRPRSFDSSH
jgi:hypothetical protein